ncbi:MAG: LuxR C-terminal-related transcriptional regulator [Candidatus Dormibacteraeota bacterium]|nr:LuxR C-terminal-related transcriptional regulator [Candidatus Dormibacteraeota bacterium]
MGDRSPFGGSTAPTNDIRLAELLAALSLATDLGNGFAPETALRSCLLAVQLGADLGLRDSDLSDVYYLPLLRYLGCTAFAYEEAATFGGNDIAFRNAFAGVDFGQPREVMGAAFTHLGKDSGVTGRVRAIRAFLSQGQAFGPRMANADCEVSSRLAERLGLSRGVIEGLGFAFERWDGKGIPNGVRGENIPITACVVTLTHTLVTQMQRGHPVDAKALVARRAGTDFSPDVAAAFTRHADSLLESISAESVWDQVLEAEPASRPWLPATRQDDMATAFAYFADLKSPYTLGHSHGVARLAESAARRLRMDDSDIASVRRAALLHHLGRVGVANGIWDKAARLSGGEWERVRLYPYHTERIVGRAAALGRLAPLAGSVQERLDGSGYHRSLPATVIPTSARVLAAADVYQAMLEERPHRPALVPEQAARELTAEVDAGRLDREAVGAVLAAAGHSPSQTRTVWPAGLTEREVEVLRLVAGAKSNKRIAAVLVISDETVKNHVRHIYEKIGRSTRAGAALYAMENDLIRK